MSNAKKLLPSVRAQITDAFRAGDGVANTEEYNRPLELGRDLPLDLVGELLATVQRDFADDPAASDRWLAPRLHAVLRLTRYEAADRGLWAWLAVDLFPDYVRWRWRGRRSTEGEEPAGPPAKRFIGSERDNGLARLWWGAELFRDGADYGPVQSAFVMQDVPNTWLSLNAIHHRAAAQAALRILPSLNSKQINRLSTALDHVLTTIQLDAVAPVPGPDIIAIEEWISERADGDVVLGDGLPSGPDEDPTDSDMVARVEKLLRDVATSIGLPLPEAPKEIVG
ncbi:DUF6339 family protein [Kribbella sp. NPDC050820]|uniref:DUF6339 family protein n=1 Tax=Kribbella sp. NPDC050820 TaxID=3155408 RepID=UPI0033DEADD2